MTTTPVRPVTQSATVRAPVRHEGKPSTIGGGGDSLPDLPTTTYSVHRRAFFDARPSFCHITLTQPVLANLSIVSVPGTGTRSPADCPVQGNYGILKRTSTSQGSFDGLSKVWHPLALRRVVARDSQCKWLCAGFDVTTRWHSGCRHLMARRAASFHICRPGLPRALSDSVLAPTGQVDDRDIRRRASPTGTGFGNWRQSRGANRGVPTRRCGSSLLG